MIFDGNVGFVASILYKAYQSDGWIQQHLANLNIVLSRVSITFYFDMRVVYVRLIRILGSRMEFQKVSTKMTADIMTNSSS